MKEGWKVSTLGNFCEMYQPKTISAKEMVENGPYPVFGANGIIGRYDRYNHEESQLLITCRGATCGSVNVSEPKSWVTGNSMVIRPKNGDISLRFMEYLFRGGIDISKAITGAAQPQITRTNLIPLEIAYPVSSDEQQRIVAILDEAFDGIATAKANTEKNLQNARALFESHLQAVFSQRGEGWKHTIIGDQVVLQRGFDITKNEQSEGKVPVVSSGGIKSFHNKAMVQAPGVVIGRKGTLGKVFYLETDFWPHDTTLWVKDFKGNDPRFVYYFFTGLDVKRLDSGAANPALNRNQVHPIKVDWPPIFQQKDIVVTLEALSEETQRLESIYQRKLVALDELKKSLLHQAFNGNL